MRSCSVRVQAGEGEKAAAFAECVSFALFFFRDTTKAASTLLFQSDSISRFHSRGVFKTQRHAQEPAQIGFGILFLIYET